MTAPTHTNTPASARKPWYRVLYLQVLVGILMGVLVGGLSREFAQPEIPDALKIISTVFINLIKMIVGPIIFCTVVTGISAMDNMALAGKVGLKAILFFMFMTFFSLAIGLAISNLFQPGDGMHVDAHSLSLASLGKVAAAATSEKSTFMDFLLHIIPKTAVSAFADGEILQVLLFSLFFSASVVFLGERAKPVVAVIDSTSHVLFGIVGIIMKIAPLAAFGAMGFTVGKFGFMALIPLAKLLICFYATCFLFVFIVIGAIVQSCRLSFWQYLKYIKEEIFVVFGTCSSETVFPRMVEKMTQMGCEKSVVGMVLPTGYSFNLAGSSIYLTLAAVFLAQATDTPMTFGEQLGLIGVMMLTSKGAAGVVGTAFIALTATLASFGHIPVAAVTIIFGVDSFMAQGRSVTNLIGNGAATILMAKWEGRLDYARARAILAGEVKPVLESSSQIGRK